MTVLGGNGGSLIVSRQGAASFIQMAQPKTLNAITLASATALLETLRQLASDDTVRAVVLSGVARAFSAGGGLSYLESGSPSERAANASVLIEQVHAIVELITTYRTPRLEAGERTLREQLDAERDAFVLCAESEDFAEGIRAYRQHRRPRFP